LRIAFQNSNEDSNAQRSRVDECQTRVWSGLGIAPTTYVKIQMSALGSGKLSGVQAPPAVAENHHDGGELPHLDESF
jgi:hypothetical protein